MPPSGVVEVKAPGDHDGASLSPGGEMVPGQHLVLQGGEERLRGGVVETRPDPAHRLAYPETLAQAGETPCGVGRSAVGVKHDPSTAARPPRTAVAILIASHTSSASGCALVGQANSLRENKSSTVAR